MKITPYEQRLLKLLKTSKGYKEIASNLGVKEGTVKMMTRRLCVKVGARGGRISLLAMVINEIEGGVTKPQGVA